jgi:uncharacterized protein
MREQQIHAEWRRALKSLRAAETLQRQGLAEDAIWRAYYAVMHAAKAALLVYDVIAESHRAVRRLFGRVLVRGGEIEREWAEILAREQDQRGVADYIVDFEVDVEVAANMVRDAHRFTARMARYLSAQGLVPEEEHRC